MTTNAKKLRPQEYRYGNRARMPLPAQEILERTLNVKHLAKKIKRYSLFIDWNDIVGTRIAEIARPKKMLRGSTLLVEVVNAVWVQELSLEKPSLLKKINDACEGLPIDDIRFVAGNLK